MARSQSRILITGGAGFIGSNAAKRFYDQGREVMVIDDLSRKGSVINAKWLRKTLKGSRFKINDQLDISNREQLIKAVGKFKPEVIIHAAAQVAVTLSFEDPLRDFKSSEEGTFNVIEAARRLAEPPVIIYAGTNKEYGEFDLKLTEQKLRYWPKATDPLRKGIPETQPFNPQTPYGVSKGAGTIRILDAYGSWEIPTVVVRQSCIYGSRQMGSVDQGWVYILAELAHRNMPLTFFGDGKQVRDVLDVDDLINFYQTAMENKKAYGKVYNIGGGVKNTLSLRELAEWLTNHLGKIEIKEADWRPHDQKWYVSDISKAKKELGWEPKINVKTGLERLDEWVHQQLEIT